MSIHTENPHDFLDDSKYPDPTKDIHLSNGPSIPTASTGLTPAPNNHEVSAKPGTDVVYNAINQNVSLADIDSLDDAEAMPVSLSNDYWTPETPGECKKVIFAHFGEQQVLVLDGRKDANGDQATETIDAAFFYTKDQGQVKMMCNGSKRLVSALRAFNIQQGTPLLITYKGKMKNKNNNFQSDAWGVQPLVIHKP